MMELHGLGAEVWQGIDAQEYVDELHNEWDRAALRWIMFLHVTHVEYDAEYKLRLTFNNGAQGVVDLKAEL